MLYKNLKILAGDLNKQKEAEKNKSLNGLFFLFRLKSVRIYDRYLS